MPFETRFSLPDLRQLLGPRSQGHVAIVAQHQLFPQLFTLHPPRRGAAETGLRLLVHCPDP